MVKATKYFRKQAEKAERMARALTDEEAAQNLTNLAEAYRSQADALKRTKQLKKNDKKLGKKPGSAKAH
jgi:hypothetical protein